MTAFSKFQRILVLFLVSVAFFFGGYYFGLRGYEFEIRKNPPEIKIKNKAPKNADVDFALFWEVWDLVQAEYLERPVDGEKMLMGAITGMVASLGDPHTAFLPKPLNEVFDAALNNTYHGIGAELGLKENQLIVVAPLEGSPAKAAGVLPGDKILEIDGSTTAGLNVSEAAAKIRGKEGTSVLLLLQRGDSDSFEKPITRGVIKVDSVTWEDKGEGIAYIKINRFGGDTNREWSEVVKKINTKMVELDTIILDLRGNPGGYLQSSVYIAGEFSTDKVVLYQQSATGEEEAYKTDRVGVFTRIPKVFVLIDEGSASSSEILAAALKEHVGATLIGKKSFGKGTIQDAKNFEDGSGINITTSKWLTPTKEWIHHKGINPDVEVDGLLTADTKEGGVQPDKQLEKAIELAKQI